MLPINKIIWGLATLIIFGTLLARADDDDDDDEYSRDRYLKRRSVFAPDNPIYKEECGSCHMVYPPGLLPARSWDKMMENLKNHFGDNATLDNQLQNNIRQFLSMNAADRTALRRSQKIAKSIPADESPLRFTETYYFKRQHHEVGRKVWSRKSIGSPSNCVACHGRAEQGIFSERELSIPR